MTYDQKNKNFHLICFDNQAADFIIELVKSEEHYITIHVYKVYSWVDDLPADCESYLSGHIKWDGCSDFNFGNNGYIHLCGLSDYNKHAFLMGKIYDFARKNIPLFNESVAQ